MPKTQIFFDYAYQGIEFRIVLFIFSFLSYTLGNYFIFLISTKIHYFNKSLNKIQYFLFCHFSVKNKFNKTKDLKNCILINRNIGTIRRNKQIYKNFWDDKQLQNKLLNDKFFGKIERHCVISDYVNFFKKNKLVKAQIIHNFTTTQDKYTNEEHKLFDFVDNKNLKNTIYINDNSSIVNDVTNNELGLNIFNFNKTEKCELINEKINNPYIENILNNTLENTIINYINHENCINLNENITCLCFKCYNFIHSDNGQILYQFIKIINNI